MKKIVFATHNRHKLEEVKEILKDKIDIVGLYDIGCLEEIPETALTLEGNALAKANYVFENYGMDCFADDTGLEVDALDGRPGVYSARYAGEPSNSERNIDKLLAEMSNFSNRGAQFRTVIALVEKGKDRCFEGVIKGKIANERCGKNGFGYDPVFFPTGCSLSFAQMNPSKKNAISHRALAVDKLVRYLGENFD
ncbi:MAG: non-canonical purine NTP diphosphatase [Paludibacteraceae bacterium]